jgi:hypothetical protein
LIPSADPARSVSRAVAFLLFIQRRLLAAVATSF